MDANELKTVRSRKTCCKNMYCCGAQAWKFDSNILADPEGAEENSLHDNAGARQQQSQNATADLPCTCTRDLGGSNVYQGTPGERTPVRAPLPPRPTPQCITTKNASHFQRNGQCDSISAVSGTK